MAKAVRKQIEIDLIDRPDKLARIEIEDSSISELADSIRERGLQNPIKVAKRGERYQIVFGDRRVLAYKYLGLGRIEATVVEASEADILIDRAIENLQRVDLTPVEEASQYQDLINDGGMSIEEIARKVGKKPGTIERRVTILRWPPEFRDAVHKKLVSMTVAEELLNCGDKGKRSYFLEMAVEHGITAAVARMWVEDWRKSLAPPGPVNVEGRGEGVLAFERKVYVGCDLCDAPTEYGDLKHVNVCAECLKELHRLLSQ